MNERIIKETANEILANLIHKPEWDKPCTEKILESFAELIVKECMEVFSKELPEAGDGRMLEVINRVCDVAEHFGVAE